MRRGIIVLFVSAAVYLLTGQAQAQLRWEQRAVTLRPAPGERSIDAEFRFTNEGAGAVTFTKVDTSCGCTTARMDRQTYQPQESGVVKATLTFAGRVGWQHKDIAVQTTDPKTPIILLTLNVFIPEAVRLSATSVDWKRDAEPAPKSILVDVANRALNVTAVSCPDEQFQCELSATEAGKSYRVTVTPRTTAQVNGAFVQLKTDSPDHPSIYFQVSVSAP